MNRIAELTVIAGDVIAALVFCAIVGATFAMIVIAADAGIIRW